MLIALFERAVGFYAGLVNINAYHQPGVEAGKKAAAVGAGAAGEGAGGAVTTPQTADQIAARLALRRSRDGLPAAGTPGGERPRPGCRR